MPNKIDVNKLQRLAKRPTDRVAETRTNIEPVATDEKWPSREPVREGQFTIRARLDVIERFRILCKDDRRTYADMLEILMDSYSSK